MKLSVWALFFAVFSSFFTISGAEGAEFVEEIERDFPLRSISNFYVTNLRGEVAVQGWALEKIRIKAKKKVIADSEVEAKKLFQQMDFRYATLGDDIELAAEYGKGLSINERLKERTNPKTRMDMVVFAPSILKLKIWGMDHPVSLKSWNKQAELRSASGMITVNELKSSSVSLLCQSCPMKILNVKSELRAIGGAGNIELEQVVGSSVYVETNQGAIRSKGIQGGQLYVSRAGNISGEKLKGIVEFHTTQGNVEISDLSGFLSGRTEAGKVFAKIREWEFKDKALFESISGDIQLQLPPQFSGEVDFWSLQGKVSVDFPVEDLLQKSKQAFGPEPANRVVGRVGEIDEILKVYSEKGAIHISRGK